MSKRYVVTVQNYDNLYPINGSFIKTAACEVLRRASKNKRIDLDIVFLSDRAMRILNKRFKKSGRSTDVLSFRMDMLDGGRIKVVCQVAICPEMARSNARKFNTLFEDEVVRYLVHGILHLFGYDDGTKTARLKMFKRQENILERLWSKESCSKVLIRR